MSDVTVKAAAPLRISFVGGGTDFPHWYEPHGGAVLSATINHHAEATLRPRDDDRIRIRSLDLHQMVQYRLHESPEYDGVMDLPKAAIDRVGVHRGVDVEVRCDAPPGSGLGGSSAVVTAMAGALAAFAGRSLTADELARTSYAIEREDLGIAGGWQDQYAAAYGGFNLLEFSAQRVEVMAYEMREALESGDVDGLGEMLHDAYESKKRMNPHIAEGTRIERLFDAATKAGATGGKICGAGGGGYLLLYCRPDRQPEVRAALESLGGRLTSFAFTPTGVEARVGNVVWRPARR